MTSADYKDVPKNTFYIQVSASCPAALKLVHESQYKEGPVEATSITLNHSSLALNVGASASLTANVAPDNTTDKTVTWKSSNPAVASVDANGTVKALSAGDATITASCGKVSASCSVTVTNVEATSVTLS
ncbi:MAG: Ig-like domain-containing protein, partial [Muribaculaceae bacterium]|nr:Ig-like domain-containing protein [Muribaculaceae bacterium]